MRKTLNKNSDSGFALITILISAVLLVMIAIAFIQISSNNLGLSSMSDNGQKATLVAEAGLQYAIGQFENDPEWIEQLKNEPIEQQYSNTEEKIEGIYRLEYHEGSEDAPIEVISTGWSIDDPGTTQEAKAIFTIHEEYIEEVTETIELIEQEVQVGQ
jgi:Tfp pilus assembly protein PilX